MRAKFGSISIRRVLGPGKLLIGTSMWRIEIRGAILGLGFQVCVPGGPTFEDIYGLRSDLWRASEVSSAAEILVEDDVEEVFSTVPPR